MIGKIVISTSRHAEMVEFYRRVLDLEFSHVDVGGATLSSARAGNLALLLCPSSLSGVQAETNNIQLGFRVPDLDKAHALALSHGGAAISEAPTENGGTRVWDARDPDGNSLELLE